MKKNKLILDSRFYLLFIILFAILSLTQPAAAQVIHYSGSAWSSSCQQNQVEIGLPFLNKTSAPLQPSLGQEYIEENGVPWGGKNISAGSHTISFKVTATEPINFTTFTSTLMVPALIIKDKNNNIIYSQSTNGEAKNLATPLAMQTNDYITVEASWTAPSATYFGGWANLGEKAVMSEILYDGQAVTDGWIPGFQIMKEMYSLYVTHTACDDLFDDKRLVVSKFDQSYFDIDGFTFDQTIEGVKSRITLDSGNAYYIDWENAYSSTNAAAYWASPNNLLKKNYLRQAYSEINDAILAQSFSWGSETGNLYQQKLSEINMSYWESDKSFDIWGTSISDLNSYPDITMDGRSCVSMNIVISAKNPFSLKKINIPME